MKYRMRVYSLVFADTVLINMSLFLAFALKYEGIYGNIPVQIINKIIFITAATTILKIVCFCVFRFYDSILKYAGIFDAALIAGAILSGNIAVVLFLVLNGIRVDFGLFVIIFFFDMFFIAGIRFSFRAIKLTGSNIILRKSPKRILIVGNGDTGAAIAKDILEHPELKSLPAAIVDDDVSKLGRKINGVPIAGQYRDIPGIIEKYKIDEIIIALPSIPGRRVREIYSMCSQAGCKVKVLPSYLQMIEGTVVIQQVRDVNLEDLLGRAPIALDIEGISSCIRGKSVLVTGGGGSIGSELCRQVANYNPRELIILDNYENGAYEIQTELLLKYPRLKQSTVIANIRDKQRIRSVFCEYKPDLVFHAAAHKHVPLMEENPGEAIKNNVLGTLNMANCSHEFNVRKFILISTDKAVNPTGVMGATKRIAEMIIQAMDQKSATDFAAVRFGNVLGSSGSVVPVFRKQIEAGGPVTVTHPEVTRFFMTITEAVQLVLEACVIAKGGEIFVLDMGKPVKILDLAENLIRLSGFEPYKDVKIEFTGLRPGEKLYEELMLDEEGLRATKNNMIFVAQPVNLDIDILKARITELMEVDLDSYEEVKKALRLILPNFKAY